MKYNVATIRAAGLEARWTKTSRGAPIIKARLPNDHWYVIDAPMWEAAKKDGIKTAFENFTALAKFFSIPA